MEVIVEFEGKEYLAQYNNQTGFFEININAPNVGGIKLINITARDIIEETATEIKKIQVLKRVEEKYILNEKLVYFLDKQTFKIKDILCFENYNINIDEETNANTTFEILKKCNINNGDFVFLKLNGKIAYIGIINDLTNEDGEIKTTVTCKYISNIFNRKIVLKNQSLISNQGIEDFILYTIKSEFTESNDTFLNINFLDVEIKTHTQINKSVDNVENGIYNFHTFITNCTQNYNIVLKFFYENKRLKLEIYKDEENCKNVDTTISDVTNYTELFEKDVTAKVTVLCENKTEHSWYLKSDRTVTDNMNDEERAYGKVETLYTINEEDAYQTALNQFKSNNYKHMINFSVYRKSKIYDIDKFKIGTPINIKTNNNIVLNTYISAISDDGSDFIKYTTGNMRIKFLDKLLKERKG